MELVPNASGVWGKLHVVLRRCQQSRCGNVVAARNLKQVCGFIIRSDNLE